MVRQGGAEKAKAKQSFMREEEIDIVKLLKVRKDAGCKHLTPPRRRMTFDIATVRSSWRPTEQGVGHV